MGNLSRLKQLADYLSIPGHNDGVKDWREWGMGQGGGESAVGRKKYVFQYLRKDYLYYRNGHFPFEIQDLSERGNS